MLKIEYSLGLVRQFFLSREIVFWLEAGSALSAARDGAVFPWEHDIDVAIWRDDLEDPRLLRDFFSAKGYAVIFQKHFPFVDNIIQLRAKDDYKDQLFDIDIYLYTRCEGYAYMRWIHRPENRAARMGLVGINILKYLVNPTRRKWRNISRFLPRPISKFLFRGFLRLYLINGTCIYHRFPEKFFLELKDIVFHGLELKIPKDIENFLEYRYGPSWRVPDEEFNQTGKWRESAARVELRMCHLPAPVFDERVIDWNG